MPMDIESAEAEAVEEEPLEEEQQTHPEQQEEAAAESREQWSKKRPTLKRKRCPKKRQKMIVPLPKGLQSLQEILQESKRRPSQNRQPVSEEPDVDLEKAARWGSEPHWEGSRGLVPFPCLSWRRSLLRPAANQKRRAPITSESTTCCTASRPPSLNRRRGWPWTQPATGFRRTRGRRGRGCNTWASRFNTQRPSQDAAPRSRSHERLSDLIQMLDGDGQPLGAEGQTTGQSSPGEKRVRFEPGAVLQSHGTEGLGPCAGAVSRQRTAVGEHCVFFTGWRGWDGQSEWHSGIGGGDRTGR